VQFGGRTGELVAMHDVVFPNAAMLWFSELEKRIAGGTRYEVQIRGEILRFSRALAGFV
jgi:hypothetical protein